MSGGKRVTIVGGGLAGALMACYLAEAGYEVAVYERRSDPRAKGYVGGRSINLALSARGIKGLAGVGLDRVGRQLQEAGLEPAGERYRPLGESGHFVEHLRIDDGLATLRRGRGGCSCRSRTW